MRDIARRDALTRGSMALGSAVALVAAIKPAGAAYPDQAVRVIVTFPPGGSADIVIRAIEPLLASDLGATIVIDNRSGAGGIIGVSAVVQAPPDGYTLGVAAAGVLTVTPHLGTRMPFDPLTSLAPVTLLADIPFVLCASRQSGLGSLQDVQAFAKASPDQLSIGHGGNGTAMHLTAALFVQRAQVAARLVPYRGTAPATVDVLAGHIPLAVLDIPASQQLIRDGQLKAIGVSAASRVEFLPEVPSLAELGLTDFVSVGWFGVVAPAATPQPVVARLNAAILKALQDPAVVSRIKALGAQPAPSSPEQFAAFIRSESTKWAKVIADAGIRAE